MAVVLSVVETVFWEPFALALPRNVHDALSDCAKGETLPEIALMQLLVVSISEEDSERALGTAIWSVLENREVEKAERLGVVQKLWDSARDTVQIALQ